MISIVDYGVGNLGSIKNMLKKLGFASQFVSTVDAVLEAEKLILPGVGAFDSGMQHLQDAGLIDALNTKVLDQKTPVLGICLGMQLMTKSSEEGSLNGLGWIDAACVKFQFDADSRLKVPHIGWNYVHPQKESELLHEMHEEPRFYFVHSYYVKCNNESDALLNTKYGIDFSSAFEKGNVFGVQFHPEKSHKFGMQLLHNFAQRIS